MREKIQKLIDEGNAVTSIVSNGDVEMPTDISGIIHVKMDNPNWKESIRNQMDR